MASTAQIQSDWIPRQPAQCDDEPGYVESGGEQMYFVDHPARSGVSAKVLLLGPFANERTCAAIVWRRLATYLADNGFQVLRFDYRGVGESGGDFAKQGLHEWMADAEAALDRLRRVEQRPVFLLGLRLGALLASHLLAQDKADGALLWDPPTNGRDMLMTALRARLTIDMAIDPDAKRLTRDDYVRMIEAGELVDVEGFRWAKHLWDSAADFKLELPDPAARCHVIHLDKRPASRVAAPGRSDIIPVPSPEFWRRAPLLNPDLTGVFARSLEILRGWAVQMREVA